MFPWPKMMSRSHLVADSGCSSWPFLLRVNTCVSKMENPAFLWKDDALQLSANLGSVAKSCKESWSGANVLLNFMVLTVVSCSNCASCSGDSYISFHRCRGSVLFAVRQDDSGNLDWRMMAAAKWEAIEFRHPERSSKMIHLHLPGKTGVGGQMPWICAFCSASGWFWQPGLENDGRGQVGSHWVPTPRAQLQDDPSASGLENRSWRPD